MRWFYWPIVFVVAALLLAAIYIGEEKTEGIKEEQKDICSKIGVGLNKTDAERELLRTGCIKDWARINLTVPVNGIELAQTGYQVILAGPPGFIHLDRYVPTSDYASVEDAKNPVHIWYANREGLVLYVLYDIHDADMWYIYSARVNASLNEIKSAIARK